MRNAILCSVLATFGMAASSQAGVIFDDFNTNLGHFYSSVVGGSGSTNNQAPTSLSSRTTAEAKEGSGSNLLHLDPATAGNSMRVRHLSGGGSAANNTAFTTSSGVDGWIGLYLKTTTTVPLTVQIWIEGASNNGGIEKTVIGDGAWHLYEWDLDNTAGDANGWGSIGGILGGVATVADGSHTIDSVIFRSTAFQSVDIYMDFVAKSDSGSIAGMIPEPTSLSLLGLGAMGMLGRKRK